ATLAAAKYITAAGEPGEALLAEFMTQRLVVSENEEDNVIAMEIAAVLFPLIQQVAAKIFTETEGLMERLVEVLDEGERPIGVEAFRQRAEALKAVVRLLGVACGDKACREVVRDRCVDYLERIVAQGYGGESQNDTRTLAAVALAKIHCAGPRNNAHGTQLPLVVDKGSVGELARIFKTSLILQSNTTTAAATSQQESIEGLAYTSLDSSVKQALSTDHTFLTALLKTLSATTAASRGVLYSGLTVLANIAAYPPVLTEEQKKVLQLKKYAEANPSASTDGPDIGILETDEVVTGRCKKLLDAGIVPVLVAIFKNLSQTSSAPPAQVAIATAGSSLPLIPTILLSVSKTQKYRPRIVQQGGVKLLLQIYSAVTAKPTSANNTAPSNAAVAEVRHTTAHALARILVSVNPTLVFSQIPPASAIRPLLALLNTRYDDGGIPVQIGPGKVTSLLPTFEALLALTNLASMSSDGNGGGIQDLIVRVGWDQLEDVLLRARDTADAPTRIQRAAVELICNLCGSYSTLALEKFAASPQTDPRVSGRLHLLLALADAEDYLTRRAAAGALAVLTEFETVVEGVLDRERGVKVLLGMLEDEDDQGEEMAMRGLVCVRNLLGVGGDKAVERVKVEGGREGLVQAVKRARGKEVVELGVEAVRMLI
ncbi:armadillo-type protein, partial [Terfezia claveryi]